MPLVGEDRTPPKRRTTVAQAAEILGISAEAVRGRVRRRTLPVEREGGTVYVLLDHTPEDRTTAGQPRTTGDQPGDRTDLLIAELQDRVRSLEEANRENRRIIAALTARVPEIEPPRPPPDTTRIVRPEPQPPGLVQQVGATATTTLVGQAALAAFQALSVLKGNIRLTIILGVGQALLLAGTLLYVRRQRRLPSMPPLEGGRVGPQERPQEGPQERPQEGPQGHLTPSIYRFVLWSLLTVAVVFAVAIVFYIYVLSVSVM
jgi:hypothetical protein